MNPSRATTPLKGFSLVEVVMALAIISIAGLTLLASLTQSSRASGNNLSRNQSNQFENMVRAYVESQSFADLYEKLRKENQVFYAYHYRAEPFRRRADGSLLPAESDNEIVATAIRTSQDPLLKSDLATRTGEVFRIRFTPVDRDFSTTMRLPKDPADFGFPSLAVFVELYFDPLSGTNEGEWIESRKRLSFPLLISR